MRSMEIQNVPFTVSQALQKKFGTYEVLKIEELTMDSDLSYIVQLKNEKVKLALRVFTSGSYYELKKEKI